MLPNRKRAETWYFSLLIAGFALGACQGETLQVSQEARSTSHPETLAETMNASATWTVDETEDGRGTAPSAIEAVASPRLTPADLAPVKIGEIFWATDFDAAEAYARQEGKPLWMHFGEDPG